MDAFRDIVVGITFDSERNGPTRSSLRAVLQARLLAERNGGRVTLLHARPDASPVMGGALLGRDLAPDVARAVRPLVDELTEAGVFRELVVVDERPWRALAERAARGDADLVIVATRDVVREGAAHFGANTKKLLRECPCPVWVVHPNHELLRRSVLAATDLSEVGQRVVRLAADLARTWDAELHVVHALERRTLSAAEVRVSVAAALDDVPAIEPRVHVLEGHATEAILACVEDVDPDLLVMGSASRPGVLGFLIGGTAERLLDRLNNSIVAIKPERRRASLIGGAATS